MTECGITRYELVSDEGPLLGIVEHTRDCWSIDYSQHVSHTDDVPLLVEITRQLVDDPEWSSLLVDRFSGRVYSYYIDQIHTPGYAITRYWDSIDSCINYLERPGDLYVNVMDGSFVDIGIVTSVVAWTITGNEVGGAKEFIDSVVGDNQVKGSVVHRVDVRNVRSLPTPLLVTDYGLTVVEV